MALQRVNLIPPEFWVNRSQTPPPVKEILKSKDHSYKKWTEVRLQQYPYLKNEKQTREPIPIPIIGNGNTEPNFKKKPKRKRIVVSVPLFKIKSETEVSPMHSEYIPNVWRRKVLHDPTFAVYQDDAVDSFKINRSEFKYDK